MERVAYISVMHVKLPKTHPYLAQHEDTVTGLSGVVNGGSEETSSTAG